MRCFYSMVYDGCSMNEFNNNNLRNLSAEMLMVHIVMVHCLRSEYQGINVVVNIKIDVVDFR